ncbi:MAG: PSD1 and planctomycete cytochrome C domain-containing protein [Fimbriiglobus sp.]|nr:PSD1 and planctomycete cytochrome C domain-containing protein [Fimbriiglobus sp.]
MLFARSLVVLAACAAVALPADPTPEQAERFEKTIRPLLVEHCYKCHSTEAKKSKGGLRVDGRKALLDGGDGGPAIVPGDPAKSKLIEAVRYTNNDLLMPPKGKLPADAIAALEAWVKEGAPWPNDTATAEKKDDFDLAKRKAEHWAWKPLPVTRETKANTDQFIRDALKTKGLALSPPADKLTLLRRVTFALTGLPPTPAEVLACENGTETYEQAVDRLLASPAFGERWGRHWLDLARYAETRGHEFEPEIPNAYQYRDYVIRALNADVPYNRFVMEQLAGDVLPDPRIDPKTGTNESAIGSFFWHLGEEVHSPVDIRADQADRFDNRIDVATKTFLGLTVACARCHDHKFDAIGTKDYYALFGLLEGSTYRQIRIDGWKQNREVAAELAKVRAEYLGPLERAAGLPRVVPPTPAAAHRHSVVIDYTAIKPGEWLPDDVTFGNGPVKKGALRVVGDKLATEPASAAAFDPFWANLKLTPGTANDAGALGRTTRAGFSIRTPSFVLEKKKLHYLVRGGGMGFAAVGQQAVIAGPLHGGLITVFGNDDKYRWVSHDLSGYVGQRLHVELTADPKTPFAVVMVVQSDEGAPPVPFDQPKPQAVPEAAELLAELAAKEKELAKKALWQSRLAVGMWDGPGVDSPVFVRGNPRTLGTVVPHRSLEALHGPAGLTKKTGGGRLVLAELWTDPKTNPFVPRVAVNRVWHHLFGRGLVASTDNFGVLGETPTHPELLDSLSNDFVADGWSVKTLIRKLVLTDTYRQSSAGSPEADTIDPTNSLLHKFRLKRLEGEAIRGERTRGRRRPAQHLCSGAAELPVAVHARLRHAHPLQHRRPAAGVECAGAVAHFAERPARSRTGRTLGEEGARREGKHRRTDRADVSGRVLPSSHRRRGENVRRVCGRQGTGHEGVGGVGPHVVQRERIRVREVTGGIHQAEHGGRG